MPDRWTYGDVILRREVLGLAPVRQVDSTPPWLGRPWLAAPVLVVEDSDDALVTFLPSGAQFGFFDGSWPTPNGMHPWSVKTSWSGHGCLMVQRPGDHYAVWHFWSGSGRDFLCWYINIQTSFVRTEHGYDTQDLELDIVVAPDGSWTLKDEDVLVDRVREGRFSESFVAWIESLGDSLTSELTAGRPLWDRDWRAWKPDGDWRNTPLPSGWRD